MPELKTLIITNFRDVTMDRVIGRIGPSRIFRFNLDLWKEYEITIKSGGFTICNPAGHRITSGQVAKCLWRKPMLERDLEFIPLEEGDFHSDSELWYVTRKLKNLLWRSGKLVLIEPESANRVGKFVQLEIGKEFFSIPSYEFFCSPRNLAPSETVRIVKSLSGARVTKDTYLWTTKVQ